MSKKRNRYRRPVGDCITALYADEDGNIFDAPQLMGVGRVGAQTVPLTAEDLIPLPDGADLMLLPQRTALGQTADGEIIPIAGQAVAAILPPGFTRLFLPAFSPKENAAALPLYGYTALVLYRNELCAAAMLSDEAAERWNPLRYNTRRLPGLIRKVTRDLPGNRLVEHLAHCSTEWHCTTAQNLFYGRYEAGVPSSPVCNANCLGCISLQAAECCPSPQSRIRFSPTVAEIADLCAYHLTNAIDPIVSFGQGCEGEPSLNADNIAAAIAAIRERTDRGQININTNAGHTANLRKIVDAGLNSMRVSIVSAIDESYAAYYRANYRLEDVKASIGYALHHGVRVSLNLLHFPGFTDDMREATAWEKFLADYPVNMVQVRNLNIDPDTFMKTMPPVTGEFIGTKKFLQHLKEKFPTLAVGSFTHS